MKNRFHLAPCRPLAILLIALLATFGARAQAWRMALAFEETGSSVPISRASVQATATDASGNVYLTGSYNGTTRFGSFTLPGSSNGYAANAFVAKWSPFSNSFAWAYPVGGTNEAHITAIAVSGTSVYLTGSFYSPTATFGSITLTNSTSTGGSDVFVAKLTDAGSSASYAWVQQAGGPGTDIAGAIAVSGTNVYLTGSFENRSISFGTITLTSPGVSSNLFVTRLTDQGSSASFVWAEQATATEHYIAPTALAVNGPNVYLTGYFASSQVSFGPFTLTKNNIRTGLLAYLTDAFVAKLTDTGNSHSWTWVQQSGSAGYDQTLALAVNGPNVYVAGYFGSNSSSDSGTLGNTPLTFGATTLSNFGEFDGYVAKLTDAGANASFGWAHRMGGLAIDSVTALAVRGSQVYFAGAFVSPQATFGSTTLTKATGPAAAATSSWAASPTPAATVASTGCSRPAARVATSPTPLP